MVSCWDGHGINEGAYINVWFNRWEPQVRKIRFFSRRSGKLAFEIGAKEYKEEENDTIEEEEDER